MTGLLLFLIASFANVSPREILPGDLPESGFHEITDVQEKPIARRIRDLRSPTIGHPAQVHSGGHMAIWTTGKITRAFLKPADACMESVELLSVSNAPKEAFIRNVMRIPPLTPRGNYHLEVFREDGSRMEEPLAVRVTGPPHDGSFTIAVMADHQLLDPSWEIGKTALAPAQRPSHGEKAANFIMTEQIFHEVRLLDPDMVVHLGDLLFGLDFPVEYETMFRRIARSGLSVFYIPGNHDAYATYSVKLPEMGALAVGLLHCRSLVPKDLDFRANWPEIWAFISCVYSGIKEELFNHLVADGLEHWKATLGPVNHAHSRGKFHFIFLNTYGGSNRRRHSYSVYVKMFKRHIGAPMVDNYGGTLSPADLKFVQAQLDDATRKGLTPVVFGHHDPRGNMDQVRYHKNEAFPTDPIGISHFEEWNYDEDWDSDPDDGRGPESPTDNSGVSLMRMLAKTGGYYISGHLHKDAQWSYRAGEKLPLDIPVQKDLTFIKVTTAAGSTKDGSRWGYRLFTARPDGKLDLAPLVSGRLSIPGGNFWVETRVSDGSGEIIVHNALPEPVTLHIPVCVPVNQTGYRLRTGDGTAKELLFAPNVENGNRRMVFRLQAPPGKTPFGTPGILDLVLSGAMENRPPEIRISADGKPVVHGARLEKPAGYDATATMDPDGDELAEAHFLVGHEVFWGTRHVPDRPGTVRFGVRDSAGLWSFLDWTAVQAPHRAPSARGAHGCGCNCVFVTATGSGLGLLLLGLGIWFLIRRHRLRASH